MSQAPFNPVIRRARFGSPVFDGPVMQAIGNGVLSSIKSRIARAVDVNDSPAPPLKSPKDKKSFRYARYKVAKFGKKPVRDWNLTGQTIASLQVLRAKPGEVSIGPSTEHGRFRIMINNRRWPQWGLSPTDRRVLQESVASVLKTAKISAA
jgi:hypothetical protein